MLALGIIAFLVLISQIFIQRILSNNDYDAKIINIAGKQRMLSQKISKTILLWNSPLKIQIDSYKELNSSLKEWKNAHVLLQNNLNNLPSSLQKKKLESLFSEVDFEIKELITICDNINLYINNDREKTNKWVHAFLLKESFFLKKMNAYVYAYEEFASNKINRIKNVEYIVFSLVIILLLLELFFLFKPVAKQIRLTIKELISAKNSAVEMASNANVAVKQKNETLAELELLQKAINQSLFFARIDKDGVILSSGRRMQDILDKQKSGGHKHIIYENLGLSESDQHLLKQQVNAGKGTLLNHEFSVNLGNHLVEWLDISVFPIIKNKGIVEYLMVCLDITKRKKAQKKLEIFNEEKMRAKNASQKEKASLIVEAQEEERKRIAKDIHDSIGQMLTALKFNLESINLQKTKNLETQIDSLKNQTKNIILGVRMATFNLTPPELLDYGIVTALQKMVAQLNKFSKTEIIFKNTIENNLRFETIVETNLYRVTQESINNAIKYAEASYILVIINQTEELLSISVTDDGKGFNPEEKAKKTRESSEGGMGLFFMKERMEYINGRVFINSSIDSGTRVVINFPISKVKI